MANDILNGTTMLVYVNGKAIAKTTSHTMSLGVNMRDATTKDSGGKEEVLPGTSNATIAFEGLVAWKASEATKTWYDTLFDLYESKSPVTLKFYNKDAVSEPGFTGSAYLESLEMSAPTEDNVTMSGTFHITGGLTNPMMT